MRLKRGVKVYRKEERTFIPVGVEEAWKFFSNPLNLDELTPASMAFSNVYPLDAPEVYPGMLIVHKVSPVQPLKLTWVTEITHVIPRVRFVDEQRRGPFALWHHIHEFEAVDEGTLVRDILYYALPFGFLGRLAHFLQVKAQINTVFVYRQSRMKEIFTP